jgi:hypothetical protein
MRILSSILFFIGIAASSFGAIQKGVIEVGGLKGKTSLLNAQGKRAPMSRGMTFSEGYRVETLVDSTAELLLSNG